MTNNKEVNPGWKHEDQHYLRKTDPSSDPSIQILTEEDLEEEDPEQRHYFCALCKARLDFLKETGTIWRCNECMEYYDISIQDVPVKDISESKVRTYTELTHYATYDINDPNMIFVEGVAIDEDSEEYVPRNVEVLEEDGRHKHIRVKGDITKALAAMNEMDDIC